MAEIRLEPSWLKFLEPEFSKPYMSALRNFLREEISSGQIVYPPNDWIFRAFSLTSFYSVKVIILGQDPYHGPGQAQGISFSVPDQVPIPPSLNNIFKELHSDLLVKMPVSGNLIPWSEQGVFLLNASLTVRAHQAGSHQNKGWEVFTSKVIECLSRERENLVFILWGNFAQSKAELIDAKKHFILSSPHPSPFSAHRGFLGSKPFSKTNEFLFSKGIKPIDWALPS